MENLINYLEEKKIDRWHSQFTYLMQEKTWYITISLLILLIQTFLKRNIP